VRGKWGSYKSKNYCDWERNTLPLFSQKDAFQLHDEVEVQVLVLGGKGWRMNRDIDNILKPILDMLTLANVIKDDNSGIVTSVSISMSPMSYAQAAIQVKVIGWSDGLQEIPNPQGQTKPSRQVKGNPKAKPRRGSSKGTSVLGAT
jgi:Holliday junction resolvase RusA-like endonuclease